MGDDRGADARAGTGRGDGALAGQTAIVTGGATGLGAAVTRALAAAGARVVINYHSGEDAAEALVEEIGAAGGEAIAVRADVSREEEVTALFARAAEAFGGLDVLVANAGAQKDAPFAEMTLEDWRKVIDLDLTGQFLCCREAVRAFLRQGARPFSKATGKIVCMGSVHQVIPWAGHANYAAAKGGLLLMAQSLAQEVAARRIRVNVVAPGAIRTPINRAAWETPEALEKLLRLIPYGRIGEPEDVAAACTWLASDASDYVTGTTLYVDGGMLLYPAFRDGG